MTRNDDRDPTIEQAPAYPASYPRPAGGWSTLKAIGDALDAQGLGEAGKCTLARMNQHEGFACPSCAWPEPKRPQKEEFCENGAKALSWEATPRRCAPAFFAAHTVTELATWDDHDLEMQGRLTHPMAYDAAADRYVPVGWDEAFARIGAALRALPSPDMADFYTSGRTSNEAAFLYQLFVREFGTNNFPDCSNMCHEATSVGLPASLGVGKGTCLLEDLDLADAIFVWGQNPGTNSPRMMTSLRNAARRGARIVSVNPFREPSLVSFAAPEDPVEVATGSGTPISSTFLQVKVGGDAAALKGIMKALLEMDAAAAADGTARVLDWTFIRAHTSGFEAFADDLRATRWPDVTRMSGLPERELRAVAETYAGADAAVVAYGMGVTQHRRGTDNVRLLVNLLLMRGNVGKAGAGICPVRGHSNVQGDRSVGITEVPTADMLSRIRGTFGFDPPSRPGRATATTLEAIVAGRSKAFVGLGGNFATAVPDAGIVHRAMRRLDLTVQVSTKLNRGHLLHGREAFILPCLARSERDEQGGRAQFVTVEDSTSMVKPSRGANPPASAELRSEPAIVAGIARATLGSRSVVDWEWLVGDYDRIRDKIEAVFPIFEAFNDRVTRPGGFHLVNAARERVWATASGKAEFVAFEGLGEDEPIGDGALWLTTMRSHDQFNTTVYSRSDRYRGVAGDRMVLFVNAREMTLRGLSEGDLVECATVSTDGIGRAVRGLRVVPFALPDGCCGAYFPEANPLMPLYLRDPRSHTPSAKAVPVTIRPLRPAPSSHIRPSG